MRLLLTTGLAVVLSLLAQANCNAGVIVNSFGLSSPQNTVTFSELSFSAGTNITNQFAPFGITLTPGHRYNSQGAANFPGINGDYVGVSNSVPFSILFDGPVTSAAFGYAKNPTTVLVEALLEGNVVESFSQAVTFNNANTAYLGFENILLDEIRVTANVREGLVDNIQFNRAIPEPTSALIFGSLGFVALVRRRRN